MPPDTLIGFATLGATVIAGLWTVSATLLRALARMQDESNTSRRRLYEAIEKLKSEVAQAYLSRDVHGEYVKRIDDAIEEMRHEIKELSRRLGTIEHGHHASAKQPAVAAE